MNHKNRLVLLLASASLLAACATAPQTAEVAPPVAPEAVAPAAPAEPAPVTALVQEVAIPHEEFQLANGLTVLVHTDRKAPDRRRRPCGTMSAPRTSPRARPASPICSSI